MVSVIVPVYNVEKHIERCVKSIQNQSYKDIEIILIDDGSTDSSRTICESLAKSDSRIIVYQQINSGASVARNNGISYAGGEYFLFVDSDDYIDKDYIEMMLRAESDFTMCGIRKVNELNKTISLVQYEEAIHTIDSIDVVQMISCGEIFSPYCKLFKKSIIAKYDIHYPKDITWGEDGVFVADYLTHVSNIRYIGYVGYNYVRYNDNTLSTKVRPEIVEMIVKSRLYFRDRVAALCPEKACEIEQIIDNNIQKNCKFFVVRLLNNRHMSTKDKSIILDTFRKYRYTESVLAELVVFSQKAKQADSNCVSSEKIVKAFLCQNRVNACKKTWKTIKRRIYGFITK